MRRTSNQRKGVHRSRPEDDSGLSTAKTIVITQVCRAAMAYAAAEPDIGVNRSALGIQRDVVRLRNLLRVFDVRCNRG